MSGWSPSFPSKYTGSLRGKPNELLVWDYMCTCKDRNGVVDESCQTISQALGLPEEVVKRVIDQFCLPDPQSRSQENEGRRLERIQKRGFGWRVINHDVYRERARKQVYGDARTASGADAARKRDQRAERPAVSRVSRALPLSDAESDTETESETESDTPRTVAGGTKGGETPRCARLAPATWKRVPQNWQPGDDLRAWAAANVPDVNFDAELEAIRDYEFKKPHVDPAATFRTWLRTEQKVAQKRITNGAYPESETKFERAKRRLREAAE